MLRLIERGKAKIFEDPVYRQGAPVIPWDILKQKYLLHRGFLAVTFENNELAL